MIKSPKTNILADELIERTSSMLDETDQKQKKMKKVIDPGKRSKKPNELKSVENI